MRIAVVVSRSRSLLRFRGRLLQKLVELGHEVFALGPQEDDVADRLAAMGVQFVTIPIERTGLNPLADLRLLAALARQLRQLGIELVLPFTIKPVLYSSLVCRFRLRGTTCCSTITGLGHVFLDRSARGRLLRAIIRRLYRIALRGNRVVLFQNRDDEEVFRSLEILGPTQRSAVVNGSGVDLDHFARAPIPAGPTTFLMMGRVTRQKGVYDYLEAARILRARFPEVRVQLLGLFLAHPTAIGREEVAGWHRAGDIDFLGSADDVRPALHGCHVYVLPSYREGTPRSVLEALAVGRAVVTTDVPGCRETVIDGRNGFLVPCCNPAALAEAMARFVEQPELIRTMGEASYRLAREKYDVEAVNLQILQVLDLCPR